LKKQAEDYNRLNGYYPKVVITDKIYGKRENRQWTNLGNATFRILVASSPEAVIDQIIYSSFAADNNAQILNRL